MKDFHGVFEFFFTDCVEAKTVTDNVIVWMSYRISLSVSLYRSAQPIPTPLAMRSGTEGCLQRKKSLYGRKSSLDLLPTPPLPLKETRE